MDRLRSAEKRLAKAVTHLEKASRAGGADPELGELAAALEAAQNENARLSETAEAVSTRLDRTIERLKSVLEA